MMKEVITLNRKEFLEILRDYLKQHFSENELNDIIRDYEEYFVDGEIEGKSDLETIAALGSPKFIANDLISQMKDKDNNDKKDKIEKTYINLKNKTKEMFFKSKSYIEEKLTPDSQKKGSLSNKAVSIILFLLSLALIMPAFSIILFMVAVAAVLIISLIFFVIAIPLMISVTWPSPQISCFFIFISMAFIGFQILSWQIFVFIVRLMRKIYRRYINWIKTRKIYVDADIRKEEINLNKNQGGKEHE